MEVILGAKISCVPNAQQLWLEQVSPTVINTGLNTLISSANGAARSHSGSAMATLTTVIHAIVSQVETSRKIAMELTAP